MSEKMNKFVLYFKAIAIDIINKLDWGFLAFGKKDYSPQVVQLLHYLFQSGFICYGNKILTSFKFI